jgi:hypothetical protein
VVRSCRWLREVALESETEATEGSPVAAGGSSTSGIGWAGSVESWRVSKIEEAEGRSERSSSGCGSVAQQWEYVEDDTVAPVDTERP